MGEEDDGATIMSVLLGGRCARGRVSAQLGLPGTQVGESESGFLITNLGISDLIALRAGGAFLRNGGFMAVAHGRLREEAFEIFAAQAGD
jgi:hypothetical protein